MIKFGDLNFKEASLVLKGDQQSDDTEKEARDLLTLIGFDFKIEFDIKDEQAILFFIAGFLSFGELKHISCESCVPLFAKDKHTAPKIQFVDSNVENFNYRAEFLEQINRGGLCTPSDSMYMCALYARQLYQKIYDKGEIQSMFMAFKNQRNVFAASLEMKMQYDTNSAAILEQTCKLEVPHKFSDRIKSIGDRVFNTFSQNFVSERKDEIHANRKRSGTRYDKESKSDRKKKKCCILTYTGIVFVENWPDSFMSFFRL